jgi:hypothetical protein
MLGDPCPPDLPERLNHHLPVWILLPMVVPSWCTSAGMRAFRVVFFLRSRQ